MEENVNGYYDEDGCYYAPTVYIPENATEDEAIELILKDIKEQNGRINRTA